MLAAIQFPTRGNRFSYVWEVAFPRVGSAHASRCIQRYPAEAWGVLYILMT